MSDCQDLKLFYRVCTQDQQPNERLFITSTSKAIQIYRQAMIASGSTGGGVGGGGRSRLEIQIRSRTYYRYFLPKWVCLVSQWASWVTRGMRNSTNDTSLSAISHYRSLHHFKVGPLLRDTRCYRWPPLVAEGVALTASGLIQTQTYTDTHTQTTPGDRWGQHPVTWSSSRETINETGGVYSSTRLQVLLFGLANRRKILILKGLLLLCNWSI